MIKNDIETLFRNHIIPDENDVDKLNAQLKIFDYEFQVDYEKLKLKEEGRANAFNYGFIIK